MKKGLAWIILSVFFLFVLSSLAAADRGSFVMRPVTLKENVNIYDAGQKAIICWDKGKEALILSTDKYASQEAKVLEFMPLPSKPTRVDKVDQSIFDGVSRLIARHRPRVAHSANRDGGNMKSAGRTESMSAEPAVQIVFHKKIDSHDITIGQVKRMNGFVDWVKKFLSKQGMQYNEKDLVNLKPVVEDYLKRGYDYYVFDVIDLGTEKKSIAPILYEFQSESLYYPLLVTTLSEGETNIGLYLFTKFKTDVWGSKTGVVSGFYAEGSRVNYDQPIKFKVTVDEMNNVSQEIGKFFAPAEDEEVWFSAAKFVGSTKTLTRDFILKPVMAGNPKKNMANKQ
jgi:hypothetical protein